MGVTVTRNFGPLTDIPLVTKSDWGRVGRLARERIVARTVSGRDASGAPFKPYSKGYAKQMAAMGQSTMPDLQLSGEMLRAITVEPDERGVTLAFSS